MTNKKKVFVSGCFDLMHSGHIAFFEEASTLGDLYVSIGSDATIRELKNHEPICMEDERLYMVQSVRFVTKAFIGSGHGKLDFLPELETVKPDIFFVNEDGASAEKEQMCKERNIKYIVRKRLPKNLLPYRSTTSFRQMMKEQEDKRNK